MTPEDRRTAVTLARTTATISERRACRYTGFARSSGRYRTRRPSRVELRNRLHTLAILRPRWGYRRLYRLLRREGQIVNKKLVQRVYREEGLHVRRRKRKRIAVLRTPMPVPTQANDRWSMDFVSDALGDGRKFRALTIVDDLTRESPAIEVDVSLPGARGARPRSGGRHSRHPKAIVLDNGPEFRGEAPDQWAHAHRVALHFIEPGKPVQNAFAESFNGRFRDERVISRTADGQTTTFSYQSATQSSEGHVAALNAESDDTLYVNATDRIARAVTRRNGNWYRLDYTYNSDGALSNMTATSNTWGGAKTQAFFYNATGALQYFDTWAGRTTLSGFGNEDLATSIAYPNGLSLSRASRRSTAATSSSSTSRT